jgi:lipid-A-disaccharide synthase
MILANLAIGENVMPELLQEDCTVEKLTVALLPLLSDTPDRRRQVEGFARLDRIMGIAEARSGAASNSAKAADIVLAAARRGRTSD